MKKYESDTRWSLQGFHFDPDSDKNRLSLDVISCLLTHCTWLNIHIVPPHGIVLEIRIAEGYGARWSGDGTKVYNVM